MAARRQPATNAERQASYRGRRKNERLVRIGAEVYGPERLSQTKREAVRRAMREAGRRAIARHEHDEER